MEKTKRVYNGIGGGTVKVNTVANETVIIAVSVSKYEYDEERGVELAFEDARKFAQQLALWACRRRE